MSRVKITNLKSGAVVINSLKLTIGGGLSAIRDASVADDSDIAELQACGIISVVPIDNAALDAKPLASVAHAGAMPVRKDIRVIPALTATAPTEKTANKKDSGKKGAKKNKDKVNAPSAPVVKPGTDFRAVEGPDDAMGANVVVMGDNGPEIRKMNPGINGGPGPKYVGDTSDADPEADGFLTI